MKCALCGIWINIKQPRQENSTLLYNMASICQQDVGCDVTTHVTRLLGNVTRHVTRLLGNSHVMSRSVKNYTVFSFRGEEKEGLVIGRICGASAGSRYLENR